MYSILFREMLPTLSVFVLQKNKDTINVRAIYELGPRMYVRDDYKEIILALVSIYTFMEK